MTEHITGEHPILLPTPVAIRHQESRFSILSRFFAWSTALCLSISVLVALVSVTSERNDLSATLTCRAAATVDVNKAIINEQIALADHNVLVGAFIKLIITVPDTDPTRVTQFNDLAARIQTVDDTLTGIGNDLRKAVENQAIAVQSC